MHLRPELKGVALMLLGIFFITSNDAVTKWLAERYPMGEVICLRQIASMLFIVPFVLATSGIKSLRVVDTSGQFIRAIAFFATAALMIASLAYLPLAIATAIAFSSPLFIAALAGPFLGETVTNRRIIAILIGFAGVLIVMRPGSPSFSWVLLFPVAMAFANAVRDMMTRKLAKTETSISILFWSMLLSIILSALSIPFGWIAIAEIDIWWLLLGGLLNALAHFTMIAAYRFADASALAPYRYSSMIWAIGFGWLFWNHLPDAWSLLGAAIIVAAAISAVDRAPPKPASAKA